MKLIEIKEKTLSTKPKYINIEFTHHTDGSIRATVKKYLKDGTEEYLLFPNQDITIEEMYLDVFMNLFPDIKFMIDEVYEEEGETDE